MSPGKPSESVTSSFAQAQSKINHLVANKLLSVAYRLRKGLSL